MTTEAASDREREMAQSPQSPKPTPNLICNNRPKLIHHHHQQLAALPQHPAVVDPGANRSGMCEHDDHDAGFVCLEGPRPECGRGVRVCDICVYWVELSDILMK